MSHRFAIFCKNKSAAEMLQERIVNNFDFHKINLGESKDGNYVILCSFGMINKRPSEMAEDVTDKMGLDRLGYVIDYGSVNSEKIRVMTINHITKGNSKRRSY